mgnify:CR=1 FL=1
MFNQEVATASRSPEAVFATNKLIRNTYTLLSMTLIFSALTAGVAMISNAAPVNFWIMLIVFIGGPFLIEKFKNKVR